MEDFNSWNYCSIYSCRGDVSHPFEKDCCFHTVTKDEGDYVMDNTYSIVFFKGMDYIHETYGNNACLLSAEVINKYLKVIQQYVPFTYDLSESTYDLAHDDNNYTMHYALGLSEDCTSQFDYFKLNIHINGNILQHKFVLKMIRPLYEYPFNVELLDLLRLFKYRRFKRLGIVNLYLFVTSACCLIDFGGNDDQAICSLNCRQLVDLNKTFSDWKECLRNYNENDDWNENNINDCHSYTNISSDLLGALRRDFLRLSDGKYSLNTWEDENLFNERLKYYNTVLKIYKTR